VCLQILPIVADRGEAEAYLYERPQAAFDDRFAFGESGGDGDRLDGQRFVPLEAGDRCSLDLRC
jgi:hypothetical protein